jgi:uncharacterized RDD family membrane protein YckC
MEYPECPYIIAGTIAAYDGSPLSWTCGLYRRIADKKFCDECRHVIEKLEKYQAK